MKKKKKTITKFMKKKIKMIKMNQILKKKIKKEQKHPYQEIKMKYKIIMKKKKRRKKMMKIRSMI